MNQVQKIQKQVHTSSILICSNDTNKTFKSATWMRKTDQNFKILKKELYEGKNISAYNCNIFDFGSYTHLQLENCDGLKKIFQYGPVKLEQKMLTLLGQRSRNFKQFEVSILLNKNQKFSAKISFSKKQLPIFIIHILLDNLEINLEYQIRHKWGDYEEIFLLKDGHPNSIFLFLDSNKTQFIKKLSKLKIFCHYGYHLTINFQSEDIKKLFLIEFLDLIYLENRLFEHASVRKPNLITLAIMQNDVNNLFASTEAFSNPHTPQVPERVLEDIRNIVFTPNPQFQMQIREHGFGNFQNFIHNQSHKTLPKIVQNLKTTQTIKEEQVQQQSQSKRKKQQNLKTNQNKSHQFIFIANKNKKQSQNKLAVNSIKSGRFSTTNNQSRTFLSRHKSVQNRMISYDELLHRNRFLEERNKKLEEQNIKLKERLTTFMTFGHRQNKQKIYSIPGFLKTRQINKSKQQRTSNTLNANKYPQKLGLGRISEGILDHRHWKLRNTRMTNSKTEERKQLRNSISETKSKDRIPYNKFFDFKEPGKQLLINSSSSQFFKSLL